MSTIKTTNITHGSNTGTSNLVLDSSGNATINGNLTVTGTAPGRLGSYAILLHNVTSGSYQIPNNDTNPRPLNTELDPDGIVSLDTSTGKFTLGAGNYLIKWRETFYDTGDVVSALRRYDGTNYLAANYPQTFDVGMSVYARNNSNAHTCVTNGATRVTVPSGQNYTYVIAHHVDDYTNAGSGGKDPGTMGVHGIPVYRNFAQVEIYKENN